MVKANLVVLPIVLAIATILVSCQVSGGQNVTQSEAINEQITQVGYQSDLKVLAVESYLADIAQNVAGERVKVDTLVPLGVDPHAFEPTPQDVARVAESQVLIVNGAGLEYWLEELLANAGGDQQVIEAASGLTSREPQSGEPSSDDANVSNPHFWLDPQYIFRYVENIRDGLSQADPQGKAIYEKNAAIYIEQLKELDTWIQGQVEQIPPERRMLVTNHESLGYFADRYGFKIAGVIIPSVSSGASPSAKQLASLIEQIRTAGAPAIFLETGANRQLAEQVASETGIKVITSLFSHSLTAPEGAAPTYLEMMRYNVRAIVEALK